jgi:hypothetical protein
VAHCFRHLIPSVAVFKAMIRTRKLSEFLPIPGTIKPSLEPSWEHPSHLTAQGWRSGGKSAGLRLSARPRFEKV